MLELFIYLLPPAIGAWASWHWQDKNIRSGDDDLGVNHFLLEDAVLALLVGGGDESVSLVLEPFADTELVLCGAEESGLLLGVLVALAESVSRIV